MEKSRYKRVHPNAMSVLACSRLACMGDYICKMTEQEWRSIDQTEFDNMCFKYITNDIFARMPLPKGDWDDSNPKCRIWKLIGLLLSKKITKKTFEAHFALLKLENS